jgi:hypothetical protein
MDTNYVKAKERLSPQNWIIELLKVYIRMTREHNVDQQEP